MNLQYLGDALDHWKGAILGYLQTRGQLSELAVDAMATDADEWHTADHQLFASLLHIQSTQILSHSKSLVRDRVGYFAEITHQGDLFLDPDTGVATGRVGSEEKYLMPHELINLLNADRPVVCQTG